MINFIKSLFGFGPKPAEAPVAPYKLETPVAVEVQPAPVCVSCGAVCSCGPNCACGPSCTCPVCKPAKKPAAKKPRKPKAK